MTHEGRPRARRALMLTRARPALVPSESPSGPRISYVHSIPARAPQWQQFCSRPARGSSKVVSSLLTDLSPKNERDLFESIHIPQHNAAPSALQLRHSRLQLCDPSLRST
jgi:hypothetical protein